MREVFFRKWRWEVPTEWNELSQHQLLQLIRVIQTENNDVKGILLMFRAIAGISWIKFFTMRTGALLEAALSCTEFVFDKNTLTKNIIPFYKNFAGPADLLANIKMGEFCFSEFAYLKYAKSNSQDDLNELVAILYRPRKKKYNHRLNPDGDHREPFNPNLIDHNIKKISKWPKEVKYAIFCFYEGNRDHKIRMNKKVFDPSSGEESLYGLWSVMRSVSKSGHFGDFDKVQEQYVDTILMELNETVAEAEKIEAERNKVTVNQ